MDKTAFHLPPVKGGVQRFAYIVEDIDTVHAVFAGEGIDGDFGCRRTVGEVIERLAAAGRRDPMDFRRLVEAGGGELDSRHVGGADQIGEGDFLIADADPVGQEDDLLAGDSPVFDREVDQAFLDGVGARSGRLCR